MARARTIKPGFFTNELLAECSPFARLLFAGLWCVADREGRLEDRPRKIRAELLPYEAGLDADALLSELAARGFVVRYEVDGTRYLCIPEFNKHQNVHPREVASVIPEPRKGEPLHGQDKPFPKPAGQDLLLLQDPQDPPSQLPSASASEAGQEARSGGGTEDARSTGAPEQGSGVAGGREGNQQPGTVRGVHLANSVTVQASLVAGSTPAPSTEPAAPPAPVAGAAETRRTGRASAAPEPKRKDADTPQGRCFAYWRDVAWPKLVAGTDYPDHKEDFIQLSAALRKLDEADVRLAMDRAVADPWWREKGLNLATVCAKAAKFLSQSTGPPARQVTAAAEPPRSETRRVEIVR